MQRHSGESCNKQRATNNAQQTTRNKQRATNNAQQITPQARAATRMYVCVCVHVCTCEYVRECSVVVASPATKNAQQRTTEARAVTRMCVCVCAHVCMCGLGKGCESQKVTFVISEGVLALIKASYAPLHAATLRYSRPTSTTSKMAEFDAAQSPCRDALIRSPHAS